MENVTRKLMKADTVVCRACGQFFETGFKVHGKHRQAGDLLCPECGNQLHWITPSASWV